MLPYDRAYKIYISSVKVLLIQRKWEKNKFPFQKKKLFSHISEC